MFIKSASLIIRLQHYWQNVYYWGTVGHPLKMLQYYSKHRHLFFLRRLFYRQEIPFLEALYLFVLQTVKIHRKIWWIKIISHSLYIIISPQTHPFLPFWQLFSYDTISKQRPFLLTSIYILLLNSDKKSFTTNELI